ncbi:MAG: hypothetical protein AAF299_19210 [Pseudomonadota bacterium]
MTNPIENAAYVSVGRACGFAGLGIFCIVIGLSFDAGLAALVGSKLSIALSLILLVFAWRAPTRNYKRTETWLILKPGDRPQADVAQRLIGGALRTVYLWFAQQIAVVTIVFSLSAVVLQAQVLVS